MTVLSPSGAHGWFRQAQAIAELTRLLRAPGNFSVAAFRVDPSFTKLHGDPRFQALLNDPKNNAPLF